MSGYARDINGVETPELLMKLETQFKRITFEEPLTLRRQQREGWSLLEWEKQETLERVLTEPGGVDDVRGWQFFHANFK